MDGPAVQLPPQVMVMNVLNDKIKMWGSNVSPKGGWQFTELYNVISDSNNRF